jgi:hypothetical protein
MCDPSMLREEHRKVRIDGVSARRPECRGQKRDDDGLAPDHAEALYESCRGHTGAEIPRQPEGKSNCGQQRENPDYRESQAPSEGVTDNSAERDAQGDRHGRSRCHRRQRLSAPRRLDHGTRQGGSVRHVQARRKGEKDPRPQ